MASKNSSRLNRRGGGGACFRRPACRYQKVYDWTTAADRAAAVPGEGPAQRNRLPLGTRRRPGRPWRGFHAGKAGGTKWKAYLPGTSGQGIPPGPRPPAAGPMGAGDPEADTGLFGEHAGAGMHGELCQEIQPRPGGLLRLPSGGERDYQPHNGAVTGRPSGTGVCPPRGQRLRLRGKRLFGVAGPAGVPAVRAAGRGG